MEKITTENALRTIRQLRSESSEAWDGAIDGVIGINIDEIVKKEDEVAEAADSALECYDAAIELLERLDDPNWRSTARNHLCEAKTLEDEWGDSSCAISAIEAIDSINSEE